MSKSEQKSSRVTRFLCGILAILIFGGISLFSESYFKGASDALMEASKITVPMPNVDKVDSTFDGKLVYTQGMATTKQGVSDEFFGIKIDELGLVSRVEYLQWVESYKTKKVTQSDGSTKKQRTYKYDKRWVASPVSTSGFNKSKDNTLILDLQSKTTFAQDVGLGAYDLSLGLLQGLTNTQPFTGSFSQETLNNIHEKILAYAKRNSDQAESVVEYYDDIENNRNPYILASVVDGNMIFLGEEYNDPDAGDIRISFSVIPKQKVSLIGKVDKNHLEVFKSSEGQELVLIRSGTMAMKQILQTQADAHDRFLWILRALCTIFLIVGSRYMLALFAPVDNNEGPVLGMNQWLAGIFVGLILTGICTGIGLFIL